MPSSETRKQSSTDACAPAPRSEQHEIGFELAQTAQQPHAAQMARLRVGEIAVGRGDQLEVRKRRIDQELAEIFFPLGDEVGERLLGRRDAEAGVQVRTLEIHVDDDDALACARERCSEVRGHEGLADTALATADGEQPRSGQARTAGADRIVGRMRRRNHVRLPH